MEKNKFKKRRKSVVDIFNAIFWFGVIEVAGEIIFKILSKHCKYFCFFYHWINKSQ